MVGVQWSGAAYWPYFIRSLGFKQSLSDPLDLVTYTSEFTQFVGSDTFTMMPCNCKESSSFLSGSRGALGNLRGGCITGGPDGSNRPGAQGYELS